MQELVTRQSKIPRVAQHILFWAGYVFFYTMLWGTMYDNHWLEFRSQLVSLPIKLLATYITIYYLTPKFLLSGRYYIFFILLAVILLFCGFFQLLITKYIEQPWLYPKENWDIPLFYPAKIVKYANGIYPVVAIATLVKFFRYWYKNQQTTQQLAQEKLEAELKFLKAQIHPHFLFNTLNNVYALTLKKSDNAPEMVLKLSDLLNYMLYECNAAKVLLKKEIVLVENYLALEKLRYGERLDASFNVMGTISNEQIAPLLILPFVENSFKHGVSGSTGESWVSIDLQVKNDEMTLKVENSKGSGNGKDEQNYKAGIGLNNVRRRLELLYEDAHELKILDTEDSYLVVLKLKLI